MRRREFVLGLAGAAMGWPLAVAAPHPGRTYRIGLLVPGPLAPQLARADEVIE